MKRRRCHHPSTKVVVKAGDVAGVRFAVQVLRDSLAAGTEFHEEFDAAKQLLMMAFSAQHIILHASSLTEGGPPWALLGVADVIEHGKALAQLQCELRQLLVEAGVANPEA